MEDWRCENLVKEFQKEREDIRGDNWSAWLSWRKKDRTFSCTFELPRRQAEPVLPKLYRNPVVLALEWQRRLETGVATSRAYFARELGVTRAHVTQVLRLLCLSTEIQQAVLALGDPIERRIVGARTLRSPVELLTEEQQRRITNLIGRTRNQRFNL